MGEIGQSESFFTTSWEKIGKVAKQVKLGEMGGIDHSESFCATFVGNDWKCCEAGKIGHSESFT